MKPRILVPFDFSTSAEAALAWAVDLQKTTGSEPLRMIHVISPRPPGMEDVPLEVPLPSDDEVGRLTRSMHDAARRNGAEVSAHVVVRSSPAGDVIIDAARSIGADVIVMGTRGRTGVKHLLLGSVAEHVLRHAECPVVTVHASAPTTA